MDLDKFNLEELSMDELRKLFAAAEKIFNEKKKALQEVCEHPEVVEIMYMRPGATYQGCKICQKNMTDYTKLTWTNTQNDSD